MFWIFYFLDCIYCVLWLVQQLWQQSIMIKFQEKRNRYLRNFDTSLQIQKIDVLLSELLLVSVSRAKCLN